MPLKEIICLRITVREISVNEFEQTRKMMKMVTGSKMAGMMGKMKNMPGMPKMPKL